MRIIIASIQAPFIRGGGELHISNLKKALQDHGHEVEIVSFPFSFSPESSIEDLMEYCSKQDFEFFGGYQIDKVISLQFPAYYVQHKNKTIWLMHQHRVVYDLFDNIEHTASLMRLKQNVEEFDNKHLRECSHLYANSKNVAKRLKQFNDIESIPLYHPPADEEKFYCEENYGFIFYPSRLHFLKRQELLIRAMQYTVSDAVAIISGEGTQRGAYEKLIKELGVSNKVRMLGYISDEEKIIYYARSLAVFFAPYDEDYGYITLEAMLSSKPMITCTDSGGPLEFVVDGETGFIVEPDPIQVAKKIDWLYMNQKKAGNMGQNGRQHYLNKNITWENVVETLLKS